ncbi:MAG: transketolase C-terminal domain-containing protein [Candidatus Thermoplasmatota archaeon]
MRNSMVSKLIHGNYAASYGAKLCRAEVIAAYPITPQTQVVEKIADFIADSEFSPQFIKVESEHSAMAALIAASNTGARTFTATSAHGLLLMHELLHWASAARAPVVMVNINRALAPPWSVWADHGDSIAQRDTGWLQFYCESSQEILDTIIQAYKIAEKKEILLPVLISQDAFYLSHTVEPVEIPEQKDVDSFLPRYDPPYKLDVDFPLSFGSLSMPNQWYMELRYLIASAMENAKKEIVKVDNEFKKIFGRSYGGLLDNYKCDDADAVILCAGTAASTTREVVDKLREEGKKVGVARLRVFRPFPTEEIRELAKKTEVIGVLERSYTFGEGGAFFNETKSAIYRLKERPIVKNYIIGIGGRDITMKEIENIFKDCLRIKEKDLDKEIDWIGLKV